MNMGRLTGIILSVIGFGIAVIAGLFLAVQVSNEQLSAGGAVVGAAIAFIPVALLVGFGVFLYVKGGREAERESVMQKQRKMLDIVKSRGQVGIPELALEMQVSVDQVKSLVHDLVGLQVFSGYVNWEKGMLYSSDAGRLRDLKQCQNCGAPIELVGKGTIACKFCGTEYFLM